MTTYASAMENLFAGPLLAPFPNGTQWWTDEAGNVLHWNARRDVYSTTLITRFRDSGRLIMTSVEIWGEELSRADTGEQALQQLVYGKIKLLQMRHWMALCYDRGGYC